jgi:hypothetical protein
MKKKLHIEFVGIFLVSVKTVIEHPYLCHAILIPLSVLGTITSVAHLLNP